MLTQYSSPGCGQCIVSAKYMDKAGVAYNKLPSTEVPASALAAVESQGMDRSAPIVIDSVTGKTWSGFRPDLIDKFGNPPLSAAG